MTKHLWLCLIAVFFVSCSATKKANTPTPQESEEELSDITVEKRQLDTMVVTPEPEELPEEFEFELFDTNTTFELTTYNPSYTRTNDLIHTRLDLRFDWEKEAVIGKAELELKPYFYPVETVTLDAKGFEINEIKLIPGDKTLNYNYNDTLITIFLDKEYSTDESYTLSIDYVARPSESGGSAAITSNKGLFFINPRGEEKNKPRQIWTQGETEWNSRWFPTIDKPNERCTQEMYITVDEQYVTLSNGLLESSTDNEDGTRTDYWKMNQPHAPYLFMLTVGEFAVVKDQWEDIPLSYYVEPEFEADAPYIFPHTPEMLGFFSKKLDFKYPWDKYAQIVVRDYVSGAMENTTAVVFGEFMQRKKNELIDELYNEKVVAHEMFHHWFGDYVTCESWANLTMNEGFANYSEFLWLEHKYGRDEADAHMLQEWQGYIGSAQDGGHPLIHYSYEDKEDMFDAHSYNKGGSVLHMLREYVGDRAFWAALNKYLKDNAYEAVEVHDLRLAFEAVTGRDLNWFWDQWYFSQGHPIFDLAYDYELEDNLASLTVQQIQDPANMRAIFEIPSRVRIFYTDGSFVDEPITINQRTQTFEFAVKERPALMVFDPDRVLLCEIKNDNTPTDALPFAYKNVKALYHRLIGLQGAIETQSPETRTLLSMALKDPYWGIRGLAMSMIQDPTNEELQTIRKIAGADPHSSARAAAFESLAQNGDEQAASVAIQAMERDSSEAVISAALNCLIKVDSNRAIDYVEKFKNAESLFMVTTVAELYASSGDTKYLSFFEEKLQDDMMEGFTAVTFYDLYQSLLVKADKEKIENSIEKLYSIATSTDNPPLRRAAGTIALYRMRVDFEEGTTALQPEVEAIKSTLVNEINQKIRAIKEKEEDDYLISIYLNIRE